MERMNPPAVPEQPVAVLEEADLVRLLDSCKGNTFENRRDAAIIRLFLDTGMRAGELTTLGVSDLDFDHDVALVMGKGRRGRATPFGARTAAEGLQRRLRLPALRSPPRAIRPHTARAGLVRKTGLTAPCCKVGTWLPREALSNIVFV